LPTVQVLVFGLTVDGATPLQCYHRLRTVSKFCEWERNNDRSIWSPNMTPFPGWPDAQTLAHCSLKLKWVCPPHKLITHAWGS
jgi:hypothetical protein